MPFTIPTYFTAVDKFSNIIKGMGTAVTNFAAKAETAVSKVERGFRKITPAISEVQSQILSLIGTAAIISGIIAGTMFTVKSVMDYETAIANLSAITGTTGTALDKFKTQIKAVALETKESSITVANAFTMIGNNSPQLLKDADALAEVTKQSIILAQAAKMELAPAADYLTKIMNQFNVPASEARRVIDLLAGGMVIGSTDINKVSEAMLIFGGAAGQAGMQLNESVTAIEAISDKVTDMSRLGTQFRNIFSRMEHASVLDKNAVTALRAAKVDMTILESKTTPFVNKLKELKKLQNVKGGMVAVFNEENMQSLIPLLNSIPKYESMLKSLNAEVEKGGIAQNMANVNNATLARMIEQLKNKFVTWITTSKEAAGAIEMAKVAVGFLANNLTTIIKVGGTAILIFTGLYLAVKTARAVLTLYNFALKAITASQWLFNTAAAANPLVIFIAVVLVVIGLVLLAVKYFDSWGASFMALGAIAAVFFAPFTAALLIIISIVESFRRNWDMITNAFTNGGIIEGINAIGLTLIDVILYPLQQIFSLISKFTGFEWADNAAKSLEKFRGDLGLNISGNEDKNETPINPKAIQNNSLINTMNTNTNNNNKNVTVDFKNLPKGVEVNEGGGGSFSSVIPSQSSTMFSW